MKIMFFWEHGKDAHRDSAQGALNDSSRSLIWNFLEQIVFLKIGEKVSKVLKLAQFWVRRPWTKPLGYGGWLDASKPLVLAGGAPSGGFFPAKKASKNQIIRIYSKIHVFTCFYEKNLVVYHDQGHDLDHDFDHDKQPSFFYKNK